MRLLVENVLKTQICCFSGYVIHIHVYRDTQRNIEEFV